MIHIINQQIMSKKQTFPIIHTIVCPIILFLYSVLHCTPPLLNIDFRLFAI